jgi:hypothetical protein
MIGVIAGMIFIARGHNLPVAQEFTVEAHR